MGTVGPTAVSACVHAISCAAHSVAVSMQVLLDDAPGLLGSVVDVRITSCTRWSTFGTVAAWVYRCPEPQQPDVSSSALLRARARVSAARDRDSAQVRGKATVQAPPPPSADADQIGLHARGTALHVGEERDTDSLHSDSRRHSGASDGPAQLLSNIDAERGSRCTTSMDGNLWSESVMWRELWQGVQQQWRGVLGRVDIDRMLLGGVAVGLCGLLVSYSLMTRR